MTVLYSDQLAGGATYDPTYHGTDGPLKVGWKNQMMNISFPEVLNSTYKQAGVPYITDIAGGNMAGWNVFPSTIDVELNVRDRAAAMQAGEACTLRVCRHDAPLTPPGPRQQRRAPSAAPAPYARHSRP